MTPTTRQRRDEGLSLVELLVTMGIFGTLMVLVSGLLINGLTSIRDASQYSDVQQDQRNAMLVLARAIRYLDNATEGLTPGPSITEATSDRLRFYSVAGLGDVAGWPYDVTVDVVDSGANPGLTMSVRQPVVTNDDVSGYTDLAPRTLIRTTAMSQPQVAFTYYVRQDINGELTDLPTAPPSADDTVAFATWASSLSAIGVEITDSNSGLTTEQTIVLVNPR